MDKIVFEQMNASGTPLLARWRGPASLPCMTEELAAQRASLRAKLLEHGAILFRGGPVASADDFQRVVESFGGEPMPYIGGITPRRRVKGSVYTSTDMTRLYEIKVHQEMSYQRTFPDQISFCCQTAPAEGGETLLVSIRKIQQEIPGAILDRFRSRGVRYIQVYHNAKVRYRELLKQRIPIIVHLCWQDTFNTDDPREVEAECRRRSLEYAWRPNGDLETYTTLPAFVVHPATGEEIWFNQATTFHFNKRSLRSPYFNLAYYIRRLTYPRTSDMPIQVSYGDGSTIPFEDLEPVYDAIDRHIVAPRWQTGDVLLADNRLVAHGRNRFRGERKVLASLLKVSFEAAPSRASSAEADHRIPEHA